MNKTKCFFLGVTLGVFICVSALSIFFGLTQSGKKMLSGFEPFAKDEVFVGLNQEDSSDFYIPTATGRPSALDSFYANNPYREYTEEYILDSSLWMEKPVDTASIDSSSVSKESSQEFIAPEFGYSQNKDASVPLGISQNSNYGLLDTSIKPATESILDRVQYENLSVEFWISPINYRGYKLENKNLILYGIIPNDSISFSEIDSSSIQMLYNGKSYILKENSNFESFHKSSEPRDDKEVLNQVD